MNEERIIEELSVEFALAIDAGGTITWADARAAKFLGARPGTTLRSLALPGSEAKVDTFVAAAAERDVDQWELALVSRNELVTVALRSKRTEGGAMIVGSLVPQRFAKLGGQMAAAMAEIAELHRQTETQRREISERHDELVRMNRALDESARGVVALHAEIDEHHDTLHRVDEIKNRMVANVSHELRTPLNSILGLSRLLLDRSDGELNEEQDKQVGFIRRSAETLAQLVDDMLDLSRVDAGKALLRITPFAATDLFSAMRGMLAPLVANEVDLHFATPPSDLFLETDEGKVSQILRNFVSNALKFTERGSVEVGVHVDGDDAVFTVRDTGIGIAAEDQARIFEEFVQIDSDVQRRVKGTGLGLALSTRLAGILGGRCELESAPGQGSMFSLRIPRLHPEAQELAALVERSEEIDPNRAPVLVVEDDRQTLFLYEKYLSNAGFQVMPARSIDDARRLLTRIRPSAVVLDIMLEGETTWSFMAELKQNPATRDIPVLVVTVTSREQKARALGADEFSVKPVDKNWLISRLRRLARVGSVTKVLVVDDDDAARYVIRRMLDGLPYRVIEAASAPEAVKMAQEERPSVILLDFVLHDATALDVIDALKQDGRTAAIPIIVHTSKDLAEEERSRLALETEAIVKKENLSREVAISRIRDALVKSGLGRADDSAASETG